jgi:hypothetical protein
MNDSGNTARDHEGQEPQRGYEDYGVTGWLAGLTEAERARYYAGDPAVHPPGQPGHFWDEMTETERARWFRYTTPDQLTGYMRRRGLDITCTDPDTLRAAAATQQAATERVARERADGGPS